VILVDTSAWVAFDRATGSAGHRRLRQLLADGASIATTEPVVMEVVIGARTDEREAQLRRLLGRFHLLPFDAIGDFDRAATIYRRCRQVGFTPRGPVDCQIAAVALRCGASLLAEDADLVRIAEVVGIELDPASRQP